MLGCVQNAFQQFGLVIPLVLRLPYGGHVQSCGQHRIAPVRHQPDVNPAFALEDIQFKGEFVFFLGGNHLDVPIKNTIPEIVRKQFGGPAPDHLRNGKAVGLGRHPVGFHNLKIPYLPLLIADSPGNEQRSRDVIQNSTQVVRLGHRRLCLGLNQAVKGKRQDQVGIQPVSADPAVSSRSVLQLNVPGLTVLALQQPQEGVPASLQPEPVPFAPRVPDQFGLGPVQQLQRGGIRPFVPQIHNPGFAGSLGPQDDHRRSRLPNDFQPERILAVEVGGGSGV